MQQSLVLDLQREAMDHRVPVSRLLTKAKVIASKLGLAETEHWIQLELSGYKEARDLPEYRFVRGELKSLVPYRGWETIQIFDDRIAKIFSKRAIYQSLPELEDTMSESSAHLVITVPHEVKKDILSELSLPAHDVQYHVPRNQFVNISESVRQRIIDWTLALEKANIVGEGMTFTPQEKERATEGPVVYNVHIQNMAGNVGNISGESMVKAKQVNKHIDEDALLALIGRLRGFLNDHPFDGSDGVEHHLSDLEAQVTSGRTEPDSIKRTLKKIVSALSKTGIWAGRIVAEQEIVSYLHNLQH